MVVEEFNVGRAHIRIHDDAVVSPEEAKKILHNLGVKYHNYNQRKRYEERNNRNVKSEKCIGG